MPLRAPRVLLPALIAVMVVAVAACAAPEVSSTLQTSVGTSPSQTPVEPASTESTIAASSTTSSSIPLTDRAEISKPTTILALGTDCREPTAQFPGTSDGVLLLRLDPAQRSLPVLSVHRDLWVEIPGYGEGKINTAYFLGRAPLAIATIKSVSALDVDHYIVVGFKLFPAIVDALGGV